MALTLHNMEQELEEASRKQLREAGSAGTDAGRSSHDQSVPRAISHLFLPPTPIVLVSFLLSLVTLLVSMIPLQAHEQPYRA